MEKTEVQHEVHLDATSHLLEGDLLTESSRAGLDNRFQRWIEELKAANQNAHLHPIITDLQALRAHVGSGTLDGNVISRLLSRLAENTATVAHLADAKVQPRIVQLSAALTRAAEWTAGSDSTPEEDLLRDSARNH